MSQTEKRLQLNGREIILLGTAHVSQESINQVTESIKAESPDVVAIELDDGRLATMKNPDAWKELDIVKVLKEGKGFVMMANLVLSSFQRRMGSDVGVKPGEEMKAALNVCEELSIPTEMVDRPIQTTLKRAWGKSSFWGKCKLLGALISAAFDKEEISSEQIESLKNSSEMDGMMEELSSYLPTVKTVLIDERDQYLASHIWKCKGNKVVAVLGAGHLKGVVAYLEKLAKEEVSADTTEISKIPPASIGSKLLGWLFPIAIVALIVLGFVKGGTGASLNMLLNWVLCNGSLAALGSLLALGHPLTILVAFVGAPIATLNPVLGVGLFTGIVQAWVKKPKIQDMETLYSDVSSVKGFYKNRILKVLLVFMLSSIGGVIGNFIAVPSLITSLF